tara:strand:- start:26 stop:2614 length:2589 start_codon:yes stop_codon:yes gene_type:complete
MATAPKISNLPAAPNRQQPASFTPKSDALLSALPGFVSETNAVADYVEAAAGQVAIDKAAVDANVPLLSDAKAAAPLALQYRDTAKGYKDSAAASEAQTLQHLQDMQSAVVYQDLASVATTKGITMTAGFIDTSPNPPISVQMAGSLWREPLNTATRGSRRELPTKKVWIIEARKIALYDGDDPALPLWRDFTAGRPAYSVTKFDMVRAENGVMITSGVAGYKGYLKIDFNSDLWEYHGDGAGGNDKGTWSGPINNPALQLSGSAGVSDTGVYGTVFRAGYNLVSNYILCMDSRVYDWAPKHPISGLPVPTFALGTEEGITILNGPAGAGTYVDIVHSSSTDTVSISLNADGSLFYVTDNGVAGRYVHGRTSLPLVDELRGAGGNVSGSEFFFHSIETVDYAGQSGKLLGGSANFVADGVVAGSNGLTFLRPNQVNPDETLRAFVNTDFNTGWMAKGCQSVHLCSTDASTLSGNEVIPNGDDAALWEGTAENVVISQEGDGSLSVEATQSTTGALRSFPTVKGRAYVVEFELVSETASGNRVRIGQGGVAPIVAETSNLSVGAGRISFVATSETSSVYLRNSAVGTTVWKSLSVREGDIDQSGFGKHAKVYGSVLRQQVAENAELMGYVFQSNNDTIELPFEPEMQVGTGDFTVSIWYKNNGQGSTAYIFHLYEDGGTGYEISAFRSSSGGDQRLVAHIGGPTSNPKSASEPATDGWTNLVLRRKDGIAQWFMNGRKDGDSYASSFEVSSDSTFSVGGKSSGQSGHVQGALALFKPYNRGLSDEEIAFISNSEAAMFTPNSRCTMRGVVKKAYNVTKDRVTGMVHVGNNGGRSTFAYPLLVDESSDAALNAIAAHDGMILEN